MARADQTAIPAAYVRGGSSKAMFFHEHDIPSEGPLRDRVLKRVMGTPDPIQIDGMGGSKAVTSKIAIVRRSDRADADIDYIFAQSGVRDDTIDYSANCGNISSGVGPFAIDEGLLPQGRKGRSLDPTIDAQEVRIFNTGTRKTLIAHVPIDKSGFSISSGAYSMAAVPGTGAAILMDYRETVGASRGKGLLPTGRVVDTIEMGGKSVNITICDVANIIVFVSASDMGLTGYETATALTESRDWIAQMTELRGKAAEMVGMCQDWRQVDEQSPFMPMPVLIAGPPTDQAETHLSGRLFLDNMCHPSMAGTASVCMTACSRIKGSLVYEQVGRKGRSQNVLNIAHPLGYIPVGVEVEENTVDTTEPVFKTLSFIRTSRRLMDGHVYVPKEDFDGYNSTRESATTGVNGNATDGHAAQGVNGNVNGIVRDGEKKDLSVNAAGPEIPVTKILSSFIASARPSDLTPTLLTKVREAVLDFIGVTVSAGSSSESTPSMLAAVSALGGSNGGASTVFTKGRTFLPQYAALLNAAFGHSMDFDDTYAEGSLHAGVTVIASAFAQAESMPEEPDLSNKFLLSIAVGYEITCRIGRELGTAAYSRGFHNTSTAGIFGAIATLSVLKGIPAETVEMAFGLAGSKAAGSMQYLENGSWNKRLHPGFAAHDAFVCVALAESGVVGATKALEGKFGHLQAYSPRSKDLHRLVDSLGKKWSFLASALKPFPACRMTHGYIEMAADIASTRKGRITSIVLTLTPENYPIVAARTPNKVHPENTVDAQFSAYYQTAHAYLYGANTGWKAYDRARMTDEKIHQLCSQITVVADDKLEILGSTMTVNYADGTSTERKLPYPLGEEMHPFTEEAAFAKFLGLVEPVCGRTTAFRIKELLDKLGGTEGGDNDVQSILTLLQ